MSASAGRRRGPVEYQPTMRSRADGWRKWKRRGEVLRERKRAGAKVGKSVRCGRGLALSAPETHSHVRPVSPAMPWQGAEGGGPKRTSLASHARQREQNALASFFFVRKESAAGAAWRLLIQQTPPRWSQADRAEPDGALRARRGLLRSRARGAHAPGVRALSLHLSAPSITRTVHFFEHPVHGLQVGVVEEPDLGVLVVLLEGDWRVGEGRERHETIDTFVFRSRPPLPRPASLHSLRLSARTSERNSYPQKSS